MKRTFLFAAVGVAFMTAAVSTFVYVNNGSNSMDELFDANVEALTQDEIIVGPLCMECPNAACTSLGEVFLESVRA